MPTLTSPPPTTRTRLASRNADLSTSAAGPQVTTRTLDNGLTIVVERVPNMSGCSVAVNYRAGFRDETPGRSGFAHLFEHLMFQGSAHVPEGQHFAAILGAGGTVNGNTFSDTADYHQSAPDWSMQTILQMEADRMAHLNLTQHTLDTQRRVVLEEVNLQVTGRAYGGFPWTVLPQALYTEWSNAHNGYGSPDDLYDATLGDCENFYAQYYSPANACVAVCADQPVEQLLERCAVAFATVPWRPGPAHREPHTGTSPTDRTIHDPLAPRPALAVGWSVPDPAQDLTLYTALITLSYLLTGGSNALLRAAAREVDATTDSAVGLFGPFLALRPETFIVVAHHRSGDEDLIDLLVRRCLEQVAAGTADPAIPAAQARAILQHSRDVDDLSFRARLLARSTLLFSEPLLQHRYAEAVQQLRPHHIHQAAQLLLAQRPARIHLVGDPR